MQLASYRIRSVRVYSVYGLFTLHSVQVFEIRLQSASFRFFSGILRGHVRRVLEMSPLCYFIIFLSLKYRTFVSKNANIFKK